MTFGPLSQFREVWLVDFEFHQPIGESPKPICMTGREIHSNRLIRLFADELGASPPFPTSPDSLVVAYYASAEIGCFLALGWPTPSRLLDLFAEFRCMTNGVPVPCGAGLLGALAYFGLDAMSGAEKKEMRDLALRGGPYAADEQLALLNYCQEDVDALGRLLPAMISQIDLPRALLRGRYMNAAAHMESNGTPIDTETLHRLRQDWQEIKSRLVARADRDYGVYEGQTFKLRRFEKYLALHNIPWPLTEHSKQLALDDETFRSKAKVYPQIAPLRELRHTLGQLRLNDLAVGKDSRNRCLLSAFRAKTGRNQPSSTRFIFGPSVWLRGLIKPSPGRAVAYVDYAQQEFGIAAALSGDTAMQEAYLSGDPYLAFAKQAGAVPQNATKATHKGKRELFKVCALAVQYGMGAERLALNLNRPVADARKLLRLHRETYKDFWQWIEAAVDHAMLFGFLRTVFGWRIQIGQKANPRSLANFSVQANGAEILRLACCLTTERRIQVCAPVHDALLVEDSVDAIDRTIAATQEAMREASEIVLFGFSLRAEAKIVRYPDRYMDERGERMWNLVMDLLVGIERVPA